MAYENILGNTNMLLDDICSDRINKGNYSVFTLLHLSQHTSMAVYIGDCHFVDCVSGWDGNSLLEGK